MTAQTKHDIERLTRELNCAGLNFIAAYDDWEHGRIPSFAPAEQALLKASTRLAAATLDPEAVKAAAVTLAEGAGK